MNRAGQYISVLILLIAFTFNSFAEQGKLLDPVKWTQGLYKVNDSIYLLKFEATIEDHWHVYSHYIAEGGPVPTTITFEKKENVVTVDTIQESGILHEEHDPNFDMILRWYDNNVNFYQLIKSNSEIRDALYSSYDIFLSKKYKIKVFQSSIERLKNNFR